MIKIAKYITLLSIAAFSGRSFAGVAGSTSEIRFTVSEQNNTVNCHFTTSFKCKSYTIEGRLDENSEYRTLVYCSDEMCVDPRQGVEINFDNGQFECRLFRVKTTDANGEVAYSIVQQIAAPKMREVELLNTVVSGNLYFKFTVPAEKLSYQFAISSINGEEVRKSEPVNGGYADLGTLPPGFYIITFKSAQGATYHYKFFKTQQI